MSVRKIILGIAAAAALVAAYAVIPRQTDLACRGLPLAESERHTLNSQRKSPGRCRGFDV